MTHRNLSIFPVFAIALLATFAAPLLEDVIELKTGQKIEGEVLKDSAAELIVDLGVDVVKIPVSQVKSRQASAGVATADAKGTKADKNDIYATAELPVRTIKELSQKFGEGVVLVQTPSGL
ncbi:MAG TPA: hypothetical protein VL475_09135, partial [Planctomycetaceae bacterium]|nr:hypothetical protein [Planctomycetaceae bacterium]